MQHSKDSMILRPSGFRLSWLQHLITRFRRGGLGEARGRGERTVRRGGGAASFPPFSSAFLAILSASARLPLSRRLWASSSFSPSSPASTEPSLAPGTPPAALPLELTGSGRPPRSSMTGTRLSRFATAASTPSPTARMGMKLPSENSLEGSPRTTSSGRCWK